jgi:hypothetical protein
MRLRLAVDTEYLECPWRNIFASLRVVTHTLSAIISILLITLVLWKRHNLAFWILLLASVVIQVFLFYSIYRDISAVYKYADGQYRSHAPHLYNIGLMLIVKHIKVCGKVLILKTQASYLLCAALSLLLLQLLLTVSPSYGSLV